VRTEQILAATNQRSVWETGLPIIE